MYWIQHYVIKFVSNLRQVGGFSPGTPLTSTKTTYRHDIAEILLKVALNTITLTPDKENVYENTNDAPKINEPNVKKRAIFKNRDELQWNYKTFYLS